MVMNMQREERKPLLSLETVAPEPKVIVIDDEPYDLRPISSYSTFERKRLQTLITAVGEFDVSHEDNITSDDVQDYERALRLIVEMAMPSIPQHIHDKLRNREDGGMMFYGAIAGEVFKLFRERNGAADGDAVPEPRDIKPNRLRKLRGKLNSLTPLPTPSDSMEGDQASG